jgi:hypothetical protein
MVKSLLLGVAAAAIGLGVWLLTSTLDLGEVNALIGITAGLILGLIPDGSPIGRYGAFFIGLIFGILALIFGLIGWIGWVIMILIFTIIAGLTGGRLPLWAFILGAGTLASVYAPQFFADAWFVLDDYPTAFFLTLAASSGGFLIVIFAEMWRDRGDEPDDSESAQQSPAPQSVKK